MTDKPTRKPTSTPTGYCGTKIEIPVKNRQSERIPAGICNLACMQQQTTKNAVKMMLTTTAIITICYPIIGIELFMSNIWLLM
jgi:hypothetical protein